MYHDWPLEPLFTAAISGNRQSALQLMRHLHTRGCDPQAMLTELCWPVLEHVQLFYKADQLAELGYRYALEVLRLVADRTAALLPEQARLGQTALVTCGAQQADQIGAQMACDLLEASGYDVYYCGQWLDDQALCQEAANLSADLVVIFGASPRMLPQARQLIEGLRLMADTGQMARRPRVVVGGELFKRVSGLASQIGADQVVADPGQLGQAACEAA